MGKRAFIKDPLWGNIELFSWESNLTNHFILNRLTNIVQNSSAYRAYPGLKYSRFLHTTGVVYVATQLFVNAIRNAEPDLLAKFLKEAKSAEKNLTQGQISLLKKQLASYLGEHSEYAALLATLRMCAFIHDLGHLPFSHVFENALESFISPATEKTISIAKSVKSLRNELIEQLKEEPTDEHKGEVNKIHERLGLQLANDLAHELRGQTNDDAHLAACLIHTATKLLTAHDFPITESFIKGTVDADRIDFVRRDGHFSGLFSSSVDYGRLFTLYTLEEAEEDGGKKTVARPSPRSVSETEKLLWERFQDYKYIVMHHKVHFFDEIVENILVRLLANGQLNSFLEDLIDLLDGESAKHHGLADKHRQFGLLESLLLQFDDPWIESHIRSIYRKIVDTPKRSNAQDEDTNILFKAYVEDRKRFTSAFKSDEDFWKAVKTYAPRFYALRPKETSYGEEAISQRGFYSSALYAAKFSLQALLKRQLKCHVIVGPTDRKVNYGVRNDGLANSYHVSQLVHFLKLKKHDTMLFNLWFDDHSGKTKDEFVKTALPVIEEAIFDAVNYEKGIKELRLKC